MHVHVQDLINKRNPGILKDPKALVPRGLAWLQNKSDYKPQTLRQSVGSRTDKKEIYLMTQTSNQNTQNQDLLDLEQRS